MTPQRVQVIPVHQHRSDHERQLQEKDAEIAAHKRTIALLVQGGRAL